MSTYTVTVTVEVAVQADTPYEAMLAAGARLGDVVTPSTHMLVSNDDGYQARIRYEEAL